MYIGSNPGVGLRPSSDGSYDLFVGADTIHPEEFQAEYKSFPNYIEAQNYLTVGDNRRSNLTGSSFQDNSTSVTHPDSDSASDSTTSIEAEPEQIVVSRNNDFRDGVFFGFLLGALFILWTLRLR